MTRRWRTYLGEPARADDPVWACWSVLVAVKPDKFDGAVQALLADKAKLARWNVQVKNLLVAAPPHSREELAQLYGKLLTECDKRWHDEEQWREKLINPPPRHWLRQAGRKCVKALRRRCGPDRAPQRDRKVSTIGQVATASGAQEANR